MATNAPMTAADFDAEFDRVVDFVIEQIAPNPDDEFACEQIRKSAQDAATNSWAEGLTLDQWQGDALHRVTGH